jgi:hypothetical protein
MLKGNKTKSIFQPQIRLSSLGHDLIDRHLFNKQVKKCIITSGKLLFSLSRQNDFSTSLDGVIADIVVIISISPRVI